MQSIKDYCLYVLELFLLGAMIGGGFAVGTTGAELVKTYVPAIRVNVQPCEHVE